MDVLIDFIILAAGKGRRIENFQNKHKTLLEVRGITLLENHLLNGNRYIGNFLNKLIVVVGHRKEEIKEEVEKIIPKLKRKVYFVEGDLRGTKYGRSLHKALYESEAEYVLYVMGDHWICYEKLKKSYPFEEILKTYHKYSLTIFADPFPLIANINSQSLLLIENGKNIPQYTHVDMGLFLANRKELLYCIEKNKLFEKDFDTGDLIKNLSKVSILEVKNVPWFGCNTPEDYLKGIKKLSEKRS